MRETYIRIVRRKELYTIFKENIAFKEEDKVFLNKYFPDVYEIFVRISENSVLLKVISKTDIPIDKEMSLITKENFYYMLSESDESGKKTIMTYKYIDNLNQIMIAERESIKNRLLEELSSASEYIKEKINSLEIARSCSCSETIEIRKVYNKESYTYAIYKGNNVFSKKTRIFYCDYLPSNRDEDYFKEFRYQTIEEAIIDFYKSF